MSESAARSHIDRRSVAAVFLVTSAIAVALTWPLAAHLTTMIPSDVGDPVLNTWILWWNAYHLPLTEAWWNAPNFFPASHTMAFSEHLLGLTPISTPIIRLTGSPQLGYNIAFLLTFPLSATTAYLLCVDLTGRRDAALLGALAFGFAPYRIAHFPQIQILASFWMPLALLGLHRFVRGDGARWLVLFAVAWLMQALSNGYFLVFFSVLVGLWLLWFVRLTDWRAWARIAAAWSLAAAAMAPILLGYRETHALYGFVRQPQTIRGLSADVASVLDASPFLSIWGDLRVYHRSEGELFTGFTVVALVAIGVVLAVRRHRRHDLGRPDRAGFPFAFYVLGAVAMYVLALGPSPTWMGHTILETGPYAWLMHLPGVTSLRVPARFAMIMVLCLSVACAFAFAVVASGWSRRPRQLATGVLALAIVSETWIGAMPLWEAPRRWDISASDIQGALLVLPMLNHMNEGAAMYRGMEHGRPLVNGYSGYDPPWYHTLVQGLNDHDPAVLDVLSAAGVTQIAIVLRSDPDGAWRQFVATRASLARISVDRAYALYDLAPQIPPTLPAHVVPIAQVEASNNGERSSAMVDGDLTTWWFTRNGPDGAAGQLGDEVVVIDLGAPRRVSAVELRLGRLNLTYPRELVIEVSTDRVAWREVWRGRGEVAAIAGAFRAPDEIPMVLTFEEQSTRFVRLRQLGRDDYRWTIAELRVLAPDR